MTTDQALKFAQEEFRSQNVGSSNRLDADLLLGEVLGKSKTELILFSKEQLTEEQTVAFLKFVKRRKSGEPIAYILGVKEFYKSSFAVGPGVLIPRPETEHIVEDVLEFSKIQSVKRILDMGVGSGCIGLSCILELPEATLVGVEKSEAALTYAKKNSERLGILGRVTWIHEDVETFGSSVPELFDVIVANPPYIGPGEEVQAGVVKFEPPEALFSADRGYFHLRSWAKVAIPRLRSGGLLVFEMGSGQGAEILNFFEKTRAFEELRIKKDLAGLDRRLWAIRKSTP